MAKITDPDNLQVAVNTAATTEEVEIQTGAKTIKLTLVGDLNDTAPGKTSGVTAKALYSFLKEEWLGGVPDQSSTLRRFKFPLKMIFEGSFIWVNGWSPADQQTRDLIRDAGFQESVSTNEYACMISLGTVDAPTTDLAYYTQVAGFTQAKTDYDKTGELNENINITTNDTYKKSFLREEQKLYAEYNLLDEQGLSILGFQAYSFPLSNGEDLKLTVPTNTYRDVDIDANTDHIADVSPYGDGTYPPTSGMKLNYLKGSGFTTWANATVYPAGAVVLDAGRQSGGSSNGTWWFTPAGGTSSGTGTADDVGVTDWESYNGEEQIGTEWYAFNRVLSCNSGTDRQAYAFMQWLLRRPNGTDINANDTTSLNQRGFGSVYGEVATLLAEYVGDTLKPKGGVLLRGFDTNSTNNIVHSPISVDTGGLDSESVPLVTTEVPFPFVAAGNFNFSSNLVLDDDVDTFYTVYFEYITRTTGSYTLTLSAGATGDLTWVGTDLDHIIATDYIYLTGFVTNTGNNGLYLVNSVGANTMNITHQKGTTLVTETATVTVDENPFESPTAVIVNDNSATPMSGQITAGTIIWDFDYTNNNQGGRTPDSDAPIRVVAQALDTAEWIDATHTITKATGQNIAINASDERNYANPV